ncbi:MAG: MazG family protein [Acidimicrobiales bacterium]|nr:MazG family protein [Acidimicrobiales bacterium]
MSEKRTASVAQLVELLDTLRKECPWDARQTHASLRPHLLEETYEVLEALDNLDEETGEGVADLQEELGDLLFQVVFHARVAQDAGRFDLADVANGIYDKLRLRHPHVFAPEGEDVVQVDGPDEVIANWDRIKKQEKGRDSVLDGIPRELPALAGAAKVARRSAALGFRPEELAVGLTEGLATTDDFGKLLLALVVWGQGQGWDAEDVLRGTVAEYAQNVRGAEAAATADSLDLADADAGTRQKYWENQ